ncbi:MAG: transposase [Planctomycetota bacterium]
MAKRRQMVMGFMRRGGARKGAGRKPTGEKAGVSHKEREVLAARFPVHVTLRLSKGLPRLRNKGAYGVLREAFRRGNERSGFRLCHYSVMGNHMHLIVEAKDRRALSRGMQGLVIRMARGLNRLWERSGKVFSDRYHGHILKNPREVRHALSYVLNNARRHALALKWAIDLFASGPWFDGWRARKALVEVPSGVERPTAEPHTWLLSTGWRKRGLILPTEVPG